MIELRNVTKKFDARNGASALDGVTLGIPKGQMVAIIGPSGSGKSTLLNLMGALDRPTTGVVQVAGRSLQVMSDDERTLFRRDTVGFIFQFFNLLPSLTCVENVALPLHLRGWNRRKAHDRARDLLVRVHLEHRLKHRPEELSGGERQRVAIARALSVNPPVLLGDEPTGNLDTKTGQSILALLQELHAHLQTTIVIVTHDLSVARSCMRTVTIQDGHVVQDDWASVRDRVAAAS
ncbi:MAG: ABC transporter ATP-binding protein [Acidobacteria bacterium]|nr:ABC transporter ATP-binding protein [Acidobacteriota bacterium]